MARRTHNHALCTKNALAHAERVCQQRNMRLTPLRRRVLELIWASHTAVKAYDLLKKLQHERDGAAPPTIYRALEFLAQAGLIHRIESLNAFVGCSDPLHPHRGQFLICRRCETVNELQTPGAADSLARSAGRIGFRLDRQTIEGYGLCAACVAR